MFDFKKLLGADPAAFAGELQRLGQEGDFNPMALFAGETRFHSVFLAPFSPSLAEAIAQFMKDATGPLQGIVKSFQNNGASAAEAATSARNLFTAAQGMCVVVLSDDQGLNTVPQLFFGHLEDPYCEQVVKLCGDKFPAPKELLAALHELRTKATGGASWPLLHAGSVREAAAYWLNIADRLVAGIEEGIVPGAIERMRDLGHWAGTALAALAGQGRTFTGEQSVTIARCHLLAGDVEGALKPADGIFSAELDEELAVALIHHLADTAVGAGKPMLAAAWLGQRLQRLQERFGTAYDLVLALFKLQAAGQAGAAELQQTAELLFKANKKSFRHDLSREPLWRVTIKEPGELLDTNQAAELIGRSTTFVAKRLEQGTIPTCRQGDQVRLPKQALRAWKSLMDAYKLLD